MTSFRNVSTRAGTDDIVSNITFDVPSGQVTGLLGPNGSGKTTLLKCLLGLATPDDGRIETAAPAAGFNRPIGGALELCGFPQAMQVRHALDDQRARVHADRAHAADLLQLVGLTDRSRQRISTLSQGQTQRLRVAMALLGNPSLLVLDEPLNGLDPQGVAWLRSVIRGHANTGGSVLIASHNLTEAERVVDHIAIVNRGRLLDAGPMAPRLANGASLEQHFFSLTTDTTSPAARR